VITEEIETTKTPVQKFFHEIRSVPFVSFLIHATFWLWNGLFILLAGFFIIPAVIVPLVAGTIEGSIPVDILLCSVAIVAIVIGSIIAATWVRSNLSPDDAKVALWNTFYGIEGTLLTLMVYRLFFARELNGSITVLLSGIFLSVCLLIMYTFFSRIKLPNKITMVVQCAWIVPMMVSLYFGILLSFYVPPAAIGLVKLLFEIGRDLNLISFNLIFYLIWILFFFFTASLLLVLPVVSNWLFITKGIEAIKRSNTIFGKRATIITTAAIGSMFVLAAIMLDQNQSGDVLTKLDKKVTTRDERSVLLSEENRLRKQLRNAYLASYRYLSTVNNNHIEEMYKKIAPESFCKFLQNMFNTVAFPFIYKGKDFNADQEKAKLLYEQFFDIPVQQAEIAAINKSLNATWNREEAKAGLLNTNKKFVHLAEQKISVTQSKTLATVTIFEEYQNQTFTNQEVFYYFTLPENAVVSGLWLSDEKSIPKKYAFTVSPRGAAQEVYNNQVYVSQDPAIIEKVGPVQYRLRAFPVPAKISMNRRSETENQVLQLWLEYKAFSYPDGTIPMPTLQEKRNIYWDRKTKRTADRAFRYKNTLDWMPISTSVKAFPFGDEFVIPVNDSLRLYAKKVSDEKEYHFGGKTAIVIDRSKSMEKVQKELVSVINKFQGLFNEYTLFLGSYEWSAVSSKEKDIKDIQFFGASTLSDLIQQTHDHLLQSDQFTRIIICTDKSGYELSKDSDTSIDFNIPVSILHVGGKIPAAYPDQLMETVARSKGVFASSLNDLSIRLHTQELQSNEKNYLGMIGPYSVYSMADSAKLRTTASIAEYPEIRPVFAHMFLQDFASRNDMKNLDNLDYVHNLAKDNSLVTRYSSMIVLVNDAQKKQLEEAENKSDRFNREIESGSEIIAKPINPMQVSTTPEPYEWMLIVCLVILLLVALCYRKQFFQVVHDKAQQSRCK
jgi:putative PEP-CTERM system integral membrane protein